MIGISQLTLLDEEWIYYWRSYGTAEITRRCIYPLESPACYAWARRRGKWFCSLPANHIGPHIGYPSHNLTSNEVESIVVYREGT